MTTLNTVYDAFLSSITDYTLLTITDEEIKEDLDSYLQFAIRKFRNKCRNYLTIVDATFTVELTDEEIDIIVAWMLVAYVKPRVLGDNNMGQVMTDKNFKIYSQANQLREMVLLYRQLSKEAKKLTTEYTYLPLIKKEENK